MTTERPAALGDYPFVYRVEVRFRDLDALGHVNNAVYLTYFESGRIAYYHAVTGQSVLGPLSYVLAHVQLDYRAPLFLDDALLLGLRISQIRSKSFTTQYHGLRERDGQLIVSGESVQVAFDQQLGRSVRVPDTLRAQVEEYQSRGQRSDSNQN